MNQQRKPVLISMFNLKGGTAKTTSVINIATLLSEQYRVLVIDMDPQANVTNSLLHGHEDIYHIGRMLQQEISVMTFTTGITNLRIIPSHINLKDVNLDRKFYALKNHVLDKLVEEFDFILMDHNPSLSSYLISNALFVSDYVLIPIDSYYSIQNLNEVFAEIEGHREYNKKLQILGLFQVKYEEGLAGKWTMNGLRSGYANLMFNTKIRKAAYIQQAEIIQTPAVIEFPQSKVAQDYLSLTNEILERLQYNTLKGAKIEYTKIDLP